MTRSMSILGTLSSAICLTATLATSPAPAAVLVGDTGPEATYGQTTNFSSEGTFDFMSYVGGTVAVDKLTATGNEKTGQTRFGVLSVVRNALGSDTYLQNGSFTASQGNTIVNSGDGTNPATFTPNPGNVYARSADATDGLSFTYTMPANSAQQLNLYLESYNALGLLTITSAADGIIFQQTEAIALPASNGTAGAGHGAGVYRFTITNPSATEDVLTFQWIFSSSVGSSSSVGVQGVTVATIPEPTAMITAVALTAGMLVRRQR